MYVVPCYVKLYSAPSVNEIRVVHSGSSHLTLLPNNLLLIFILLMFKLKLTFFT